MHTDLKAKLWTMAAAALGIAACGGAQTQPTEAGAVPSAREVTQGGEGASEARCAGHGNCCAHYRAEHTCCSQAGKKGAASAPDGTPTTRPATPAPNEPK